MHKPSRSPVFYRLSESMNSYVEVFSSEEEQPSEISSKNSIKKRLSLKTKKNRIESRLNKSVSSVNERKQWKETSQSGISNIRSQILNHLAVGNTGTPNLPKLKRTIKSESSVRKKPDELLTRTLNADISRTIMTPITRTIRTPIKRPVPYRYNDDQSSSEGSSSDSAQSSDSPTALRRQLLKDFKTTDKKRSKTVDLRMEISSTTSPLHSDLKSIKRTAILSNNNNSSLTPNFRLLTTTKNVSSQRSDVKRRTIISKVSSPSNRNSSPSSTRKFVTRLKSISPISTPLKEPEVEPKLPLKKKRAIHEVKNSNEKQRKETTTDSKDGVNGNAKKKISNDVTNKKTTKSTRKESTSSSSSSSGESYSGSSSSEGSSSSGSTSDGEIRSSGSEEWKSPSKKGKMMASVVSATKPKISNTPQHNNANDEDWDCCNDFDTPQNIPRKSYSAYSNRYDARDRIRWRQSPKRSLRRRSDYSDSMKRESLLGSSKSHRRLSERFTSGSTEVSRNRSFNDHKSGYSPAVYDSKDQFNMSLFSNELKFNLHEEWDKSRVNQLRSVLCDEMTSTVKYVDTHCHIDFLFKRLPYRNYFSRYMDESFFRFPSNFEGCIADWCQPNLYSTARDILKSNSRKCKIWGAFGCHPHFVSSYDDAVEKEIEFHITQYENIVAWGEMGLDYSDRFGRTDHDLQIRVFKRQLKKACSMNLPLVIHCRDADDDLIKVMKRYVPHDTKIHRHCLTTEAIDVQPMLDHFPNCYVGFTNLLTNKNAYKPRSAVQEIPLERILLETDCPYFIPRCVSGGSKGAAKYSHPGMASSVACEIADLKGTTTNEVLTQIRRNVSRMYGI